MKAKVIIENGESEIILVPENEFEIDLIEKIHIKKEKFNTVTSFDAEYKFGEYQNHKIIIDIKEIK